MLCFELNVDDLLIVGDCCCGLDPLVFWVAVVLLVTPCWFVLFWNDAVLRYFGLW